MILNAKQKLFIAEYLVSKNATQAAIKAGYSKKTAYSQGHDLLKHPDIKKAVASAASAQMKRLEISADRTLQEIAGIGYADLTTDKQNILKNLRIKMTDKLKALELLAKHLKLLTDLTEHTGPGGGPIVILSLPSNGSEAPDESGAK